MLLALVLHHGTIQKRSLSVQWTYLLTHLWDFFTPVELTMSSRIGLVFLPCVLQQDPSEDGQWILGWCNGRSGHSWSTVLCLRLKSMKMVCSLGQMCPDYALQQGAGQESMHVAAGGNGCSVCVIQGCPSPIMWHQHFGYPSKRVFQDMVFQQSCHGFPEQLVPTVPWETCANAKSKKNPQAWVWHCAQSTNHYSLLLCICADPSKKHWWGVLLTFYKSVICTWLMWRCTQLPTCTVTGLVKQFILEIESWQVSRLWCGGTMEDVNSWKQSFKFTCTILESHYTNPTGVFVTRKV